MAKRIPLFQCQECGKRFYSTAAAERASFSDEGCPGCGGSDIDTYVPADADGWNEVDQRVVDNKYSV